MALLQFLENEDADARNKNDIFYMEWFANVIDSSFFRNCPFRNKLWFPTHLNGHLKNH